MRLESGFAPHESGLKPETELKLEFGLRLGSRVRAQWARAKLRLQALGQCRSLSQSLTELKLESKLKSRARVRVDSRVWGKGPGEAQAEVLSMSQTERELASKLQSKLKADEFMSMLGSGVGCFGATNLHLGVLQGALEGNKCARGCQHGSLSVFDLMRQGSDVAKWAATRPGPTSVTVSC